VEAVAFLSPYLCCRGIVHEIQKLELNAKFVDFSNEQQFFSKVPSKTIVL
jgi:hypothetical protein